MSSISGACLELIRAVKHSVKDSTCYGLANAHGVYSLLSHTSLGVLRMRELTVHVEKCIHDGHCVRVCPRELIVLDDQGVPEWVAGAETKCIDCGHCLAVCPTGALIVNGVEPAVCMDLGKAKQADAPSASVLLKARRSARVFRTDPVPHSTIERILDTARYAPTGGNAQQVQWLVVHDSARVRKAAQAVADWLRDECARKTERAAHMDMADMVARFDRGGDPVLRHAPHLVLTCGKKDNAGNGSIAISYFELAAASLGVGTCWGGYLMMALGELPHLRELLGLNDELQCTGAMMFGWPGVSYHRVPRRNDAVVRWL
jgi:nitroreductase/NAD-dependent dihydropyrimidine dehydrogenase PreA subunit